MVADNDDKEVNDNGTRRSFQGGTIKSSLSRTMAKATTIATATTTTMAADDDNKEVDGDGTWRSFWGGYDKGVVFEGVARAAKKAGSSLRRRLPNRGHRR
jgi:hypothetical protein